MTTSQSAQTISKVLLLFIFTVIAMPQNAFSDGFSDSVITAKPISYDIDFKPNLAKGSLHAICNMAVVNKSDKPISHIPIVLYRLFQVSEVTGQKGQQLSFTQQTLIFEDWSAFQGNFINVNLPESLAPGDTTSITITYSGRLLGYSETGMLYVQDRIDSEFSLIRMDCFAYPQIGYPAFGVNRAAGLHNFDYRVKVTVPSDYVVANGGALAEKTQSDSSVTYIYENIKPAWRMDFAIAKYLVIESGANKVFCFAEDSLGGERVLRELPRTVELYTNWFGELDKSSGFSVLEIPDGWGSQTDVTSIIQSAAAIKDSTKLAELYHEVSHLWNVSSTDKFPPRWNEGQATFLQNLTDSKFHPNKSLQQEISRIWQRVSKRLIENPEYQNIAPADFGKAGMADLSYSTGAVMFYLLHRTIGEDKFNKLIKEYYARYVHTGASTNDFISLADELTNGESNKLFSDWLTSADYVKHALANSSLADLELVYGK